MSVDRICRLSEKYKQGLFQWTMLHNNWLLLNHMSKIYYSPLTSIFIYHLSFPCGQYTHL